jgi:hypothetical protein
MKKIIFMKFAVLFLFSLIISVAEADDTSIHTVATYDVPDGQTKHLPNGTAVLVVDKFTMGENSKLVISSGTEKLTIRAKKTIVKNGSKIVGRGINGGTGKNGENGVDLNLYLGDASLHGLQVITKGGSGGRGATGSKGRRGRDASCSGTDATNGGTGGRGGTGGNGGSGGNIYVFLAPDSAPTKLILRPEGGDAGAGGSGGEGGDGGSGKRRCGPWPYWSKGSGNKGATGPGGTPGKPGLWGDYNISFIAPEKVDANMDTLKSEGFQDKHIKALKAPVK